MLTEKEEIEAEISREIDHFLDELKDSYDDDLVDEVMARNCATRLYDSEEKIIERISKMLQRLKDVRS